MNTQNINTNFVSFDDIYMFAPSKKESSNMMAEAIKAYKDECLTGLTEGLS